VEDQSSTHDGEDTVHGELAQQNVDPEFNLEAVHVLPETLAEPDAQDHQLKPEPVEWLLSTHDGEDTVHGAHVPPDVDQELKLEADHVLPVTNAEPLAKDQPLKHARAVWLSSTPDGEHMEHGAHVPPDVVLELKLEADHVSPVTHAELLAKDQPPSHDRAVCLLSTHDWELSEHGAHALPHVDLEFNLEAVCVLPVTLAVHHVTEL